MLEPSTQAVLASVLAKEAAKPRNQTPHGRIFMAGFAVGAIGAAVLHDLNTQDQDCDDGDDNLNSKKASKFQLKAAGIANEHIFKNELGYKPNSRYDICACKDGRITIAPQGQCGKVSSSFDGFTGVRWK